MGRNLFWLSDEQWLRIERRLPTDVRGVERADDRRVISGIVHVLKRGCRWCDWPPELIAARPPCARKITIGWWVLLPKLVNWFGYAERIL